MLVNSTHVADKVFDSYAQHLVARRLQRQLTQFSSRHPPHTRSHLHLLLLKHTGHNQRQVHSIRKHVLSYAARQQRALSGAEPVKEMLQLRMDRHLVGYAKFLVFGIALVEGIRRRVQRISASGIFSYSLPCQTNTKRPMLVIPAIASAVSARFSKSSQARVPVEISGSNESVDSSKIMAQSA